MYVYIYIYIYITTKTGARAPPASLERRDCDAARYDLHEEFTRLARGQAGSKYLKLS